ncbi:MAG: cobalamin biosynthesis protein [Coprothermobacterota bacterium]|nr:cobalamin biosynthesis protein [Coprothermobacterota bacterium]
MKKFKPFFLVILVLAILTPIGIYLPEKLQAGDAWGEWSPEDLSQEIGYVPQGMEKLSNIYQAPLPDYTAGELNPYLAYILSAILGILLAGGLIYLIGWAISAREH